MLFFRRLIPAIYSLDQLFSPSSGICCFLTLLKLGSLLFVPNLNATSVSVRMFILQKMKDAPKSNLIMDLIISLTRILEEDYENAS